MPTALSSNHLSVDQQVADVMNYLDSNHPTVYEKIVVEFPEWVNGLSWNGSWFDTATMGVDVEWGSWLTDAIEATGLVIWEEGEPWAM